MPHLPVNRHPPHARHLLRQRTGRTHVVLTGRGASAIIAALHALGLHQAPVVIPANSCYMVLWAVLESGNIPLLADVDPLTTHVTAQTLAAATPAPAAVIPAHMYGLPAPMPSICVWAQQSGCAVIEDAAQASGTRVEGRPAGTWGDISIFSFGRGKGADMDNGGAALTDDPLLAEAMQATANTFPLWHHNLAQHHHQWLDIYWALHQHEADNPLLATLYPTLYRMYSGITRYRLRENEWRALSQALDSFDDGTRHRTILTQIYDDALIGTPAQPIPRPEGSCLWRYPLRLTADHRDAVLQQLWGQGFTDVTRWYPTLQPMLRALAPHAPQTETPHADRLSAEIINLPLSPDTSETDALALAATIRRYFDIA